MSQRIAVVTGAGSGIGRASALALAKAGYAVVVAGRRKDELDKTVAMAGGATVVAVPTDVADEASVAALFKTVKDRFGRIDVLFNNAGITQPRKTIDISESDYDAVLDVSLRGTLLMSQAVIPAMQKQKSGSIISTSSVSAQRGGGILGGPHYSAAKAGVLGLTRAMAREFGVDGIRVNAITPGLIATDIIRGKISEDRKSAIADDIPLGRLGRPDDIAGAVVFLASDLASYCTGITLDVNGGMLIH